MRCTLLIDPSTLSSAQLKVMNFRMRRIISNPKVVRGMKRIKAAFQPYVRLAQAVQDSAPFGAVAVGIKYYFPFPQSGTKSEKASRFGGQPVVSARYGDVDNRAKATIDALRDCGAFKDDRYISSLLLRKRYTLSQPRIEIVIVPDHGGYDNEPLKLEEKTDFQRQTAKRPDFH